MNGMHETLSFLILIPFTPLSFTIHMMHGNLEIKDTQSLAVFYDFCAYGMVIVPV